MNLNIWRDNPLKVVNEPQNPNPKSNLYFLEIDKALINPNKKHPIILTIKIWSICHRKIAAGIAPIDIMKKLLFFKKVFIYYMPSKKPTVKHNIPAIREIINNLNAL